MGKALALLCASSEISHTQGILLRSSGRARHINRPLQGNGSFWNSQGNFGRGWRGKEEVTEDCGFLLERWRCPEGSQGEM